MSESRGKFTVEPAENNTYEGWPVWKRQYAGVDIVIGMWPAESGDNTFPQPAMLVDGQLVDDRPPYFPGNEDDWRIFTTVDKILETLVGDFNDQMPKALGKILPHRVMDAIRERVEIDDNGNLVVT